MVHEIFTKKDKKDAIGARVLAEREYIK